MAKASVAQGVTVVACTSHILPGLYHNSGPALREATQRLQGILDEEGISLRLATGADVHMVPDFVAGLRSGRLLSLADSRYVLVEPPHHSAPPQLEDFFFQLILAGYVPILTHPERLSWVPSRFETMRRLVQSGVWVQITAGSLAGVFGRDALYWANRMLDEGLVHVIATDAHDAERRRPDLARGRELAAKRVGAEEAQRLVVTRPLAALQDAAPSSVPRPLGVVADAETGDRPEVADDSHRRGKIRAGRADPGVRSLAGRLRRLFE